MSTESWRSREPIKERKRERESWNRATVTGRCAICSLSLLGSLVNCSRLLVWTESAESGVCLVTRIRGFIITQESEEKKPKGEAERGKPPARSGGKPKKDKKTLKYSKEG